MANKGLIYTVITGDYDKPNPCPKFSGWDYLLITDNPDIQANGWPVKLVDKSSNTVKAQRYWKICSHLLGYDLTLYIDGNMTIKTDPAPLVQRYHKGKMTLVQHPNRKCITTEGEQVISLKKDSFASVRNQVGKYIAEGMPYDFGMYASGLMIRDNSLQDFELMWWSQVEQYSHRDQLSITYALWKTKSKPNLISWRALNQYVTIGKHQPKPIMNVWYSNPFSLDKNFGKAINDFCELVPNLEDWIVIQDGDMTYLQPDFGKVIHDHIQANKKEFALLGCMTNRLAGTHQCHKGQMSDDHNILNHLEIAKTYTGNQCLEASGVAGVFMAFSKDTWLKVGKFKENTYTFDTDFCNKVRSKGLKIGVMQGLYVYHQYRPWSKTPKSDIQHLK